MADTFNYQNPKPAFDIGRVINRTFTAIKNKPIVFLLPSLIITGIPMFLLSLMPLFMGGGGLGNGDSEALEKMVQVSLYTGIGSLIAIIIGSIILQGILIFAAVKDFNGERATLGEAVRIGIRYFFPLLGLGILVMLGIFGGFILLIIPAVFISLGWSIAAPILIVEGRSIIDSIGRSWNLTKGYKRWILLFLLILAIIGVIISTILSAFTLIAGNPATVILEGGTPFYYLVNGVVTGISQAIAIMINSAGIAAVYYELRQIREGVGAESLAAIFD